MIVNMNNSDNRAELNKFVISSAQDIFNKLKHFDDLDKNEIVKVVNDYMRETRIGKPMIRIHNSEVTELVNQNTLASNLARHHANIFVIDFPYDEFYDEIFARKIVRIFLPRLVENGLLILKDSEGIRVLKKNVSYGLKPQLVGAGSHS